MDTFKGSNDLKGITQVVKSGKRSELFQNANSSDLIQDLYSFYEQRLSAQMSLLYQKIINDELITTLSESQTSSEFIEERIKEIIENQLFQEKEQVISKLASDNQAFQLKIEQLEIDNQTLASSIQSVHNQVNNLNYEGNLIALQDKLKKNTLELNEKDARIEQLLDKITRQEGQLQEKENLIQQKDIDKQRVELQLQTERNKLTHVDQLQGVEEVEKKNLQQKYDELLSKYDKLNEEFNGIRLRYEQIGVERINEQEQYKLLIDQIKVKCKDKTHNLKIKYKQYKDMSRNFQEKLIQNETEFSNKNLQVNEMKIKVQESSRAIIEYQRQIADLQAEMKQILEKLQMQTDEVERLKKLQQETIDTLQNKIEFNEKSLRDNLEESQRIIANQQVDIQYKNRQIAELSQKLTQSITDHAKQLQLLAKEADAQRDDIQQELIANSNALENDIQDLKSQLTRIQNENTVLHDENKKLFYDSHSKENRIKELEGQIKQNQSKINDLQQKLEDLNKLSNHLDEQNRSLDAQNQQFFNDNKALIAQTEEQEKAIQNLKDLETLHIQLQEKLKLIESEKASLAQTAQQHIEESEKYKNQLFELQQGQEKEKRYALDGQMRLKENEVSLKIEVERQQSEIKHNQLLFEEKLSTKQKEIEFIQIQLNSTTSEKVKCLETLSELTKKYEQQKEKLKDLQEQKIQLEAKINNLEALLQEKNNAFEKTSIQIDLLTQESQTIKEQYNQKVRQISLQEENISQYAKDNQKLNNELKDLLQEKNNVEKKLLLDLQQKTSEVAQLQQQIKATQKQLQFEAQQHNLQVEREKLYMEQQLKTFEQKCQELQQNLIQKEEEQEEFIEQLTEKETMLNEQRNQIEELKLQFQKEEDSLNSEILQLQDSLKQKEKQYHIYQKQQKEYTQDKLKGVLSSLAEARQDLTIFQSKCNSEINDTHSRTLQYFQDIMQFSREQKSKLKVQYDNEMEKYQENISTKFETQLDKERLIMRERESHFNKQISLLEQKVLEQNTRFQEEKQKYQQEINSLEERNITEKIQLNNEIIQLKNQLLKVESRSARSVEKNQKQLEMVNQNAQKSQVMYANMISDIKNKLEESEKKELQVLNETRSKIHNMKAHLQQIELEDSNEQLAHSTSSTSSMNKQNSNNDGRSSNNLNNTNNINIDSLQNNTLLQTQRTARLALQKEYEKTMKNFQKQEIPVSGNSSNKSNNSLQLSNSQNNISIRGQSKSMQTNNFVDGINYTLGSTSKYQKSPQQITNSKMSSQSNRNRSSTNHQSPYESPNQSQKQSQRSKSKNIQKNQNEKLINSSTNSPYKRNSQVEESKFTHRQLNNPSIFANNKNEKQGKDESVNYYFNNGLKQQSPLLNYQRNDTYNCDTISPFNQDNNSNIFAYSPDTTHKQNVQAHIDSVKNSQKSYAKKEYSRQNTPTYLSTLAEKSLQELKLEILKQKHRLTISRNNSQDIPSPINNQNSSHIQIKTEQNNIHKSQLQKSKADHFNQNSSQNEQEASNATYQNNQSSMSQKSSIPVRKNLMNFTHYKFASPSPNKVILQKQQKLLQSQSQPQSQSSKSKHGQPLDIQDL
ncbi:hypothetical protein TTHERM_00730370 (macronuclear) [Tetrahymena thermophila SB210]|uniref:Uncharacterized protein n=1 Tax=Tetrahymena thermophila (strain SB210) TaxID=312017 RepID=Q245H6_TETTS|nr:hypothetical protein TTHERM_00730370 [Tetrahymena thermophila SB210]EAS03388.3 hypothetical protein TTHERM_00730370 [Tetrahymena thermophila SB210]|eukprot:XP_001023633.3 hypothetical protein TTHERM_00730370 [Tetrahymena thermophila SB210]